MILLVVLAVIVGLGVLVAVGIALLSWYLLVGTFFAVALVLALALQDPSLGFPLAFPVTGALFWAAERWREDQSDST